MRETETNDSGLPALRRDDMPLTVIAKGDVLVGRLEMSGHGQVLGRLEGQIACTGELLIGPEAVVKADVQAADLVVAGSLCGDVVIRGRLKITSTGRLEGDAHVGSLLVQEGGVHFGLLHVYPKGVPDSAEAASELVEPAAHVVGTRGPSRAIAASMSRVKKVWGEIF